MKNDQKEEILARQSWLDCIGQLNEINNQYFNDLIQNEDPQLFLSLHHQNHQISGLNSKFTTQAQINFPFNIQSQKNTKRLRDQAYSEQDLSSERVCSQEIPMKQQEQDSKQSNKTEQKQGKTVKQSAYSKSYRQRKKQQMKILQEENNFLRKKINELQFRLRQKQLEINRLKYPPMQKDLTVEQLSEQFLQKTNFLLSKTAIDPINYGNTVCTPADILYKEFLHSYDQHGFGGRRKKNILNYYFNEMLQAMMRDSQKYLFLMCNKTKDPNQINGLQTYELIDHTFLEYMEMNQDKIQRMTFFYKNLHPYILELKNNCVQIYNDFKKSISQIDSIHNFMKQSYLTNMDFARSRIKFENWVDSQKHSKLMRRLRSEWLEFIKQCPENDPQQNKKNNKGSKKKKLTSKGDISSN